MRIDTPPLLLRGMAGVRRVDTVSNVGLRIRFLSDRVDSHVLKVDLIHGEVGWRGLGEMVMKVEVSKHRHSERSRSGRVDDIKNALEDRGISANEARDHSKDRREWDNDFERMSLSDPEVLPRRWLSSEGT